MPENPSRPSDSPSRFWATWDALARIEARNQGRHVSPAKKAAAPTSVKPSSLQESPSKASSEPRPHGRHPLVGAYATFQRGGITFRGRIIGVSEDERKLSVWSFASNTLRPLDPRAWAIEVEPPQRDDTVEPQ